jgi:hypothetical protein
MKKIRSLSMAGFAIFLGALALGVPGCSSSEKKESRVHPAALDAEAYFIDYGMPAREVEDKPQEFFFKKCSVDNRGAYPAKTKYNCNDQ